MDAVIAQDWGFLAAAKAVAPLLRAFAGERLGIHNAAGLEAAAQLGAARVMLPRELTLEDIAALARRSSVELGVTVQGALCSSWEGQCYMASINGRGSANRGDCPGLCREKYSLGGRMDDYPLSLKDTSGLDYIPELEAMGIACAAVGRGMKRPEQLAKLTEVCVKCARDSRKPTAGEKDELELILTGREGTDAYLRGAALEEDMLSLPGGPDRDAERAMGAVRRVYADTELRRVKVEFFALIQEGRPFRSGIQDENGNRAVWNGPEPMKAVGPELSRRSVEAELRRTSGTPYACENVNVVPRTGADAARGHAAAGAPGAHPCPERQAGRGPGHAHGPPARPRGGKAACGQARPHFRGHARRAADAGASGAGAGLHIRPPARPRGGAGAA